MARERSFAFPLVLVALMSFVVVWVLPRVEVSPIYLTVTQKAQEESATTQWPDGEPPLPNGYDPSQFELVTKVTETVRTVELVNRGDGGHVVARVTHTLSYLGDLFDDMTEYAWECKVEVLDKAFNNIQLGDWIWRTSERLFWKSGELRVIIDLSKDSLGRSGWTANHLPRLLEAFTPWGVGYEKIFWDSELGIWIFRKIGEIQ